VSDQALRYHIHDFDCDSLGHLYTGNYLRFIYDACRCTWREVAEDLGGQALLPGGWMPVRTNLDLNRSVMHGSILQVKTDITEVTGASAHTVTVVQQSDSPDPVAVCQIEWGALPDARVVEAASDMSWLANVAVRDDGRTWKEPIKAPAPPLGALTMTRKVGWRDVSPRGMVFGAVFMDYMVDSGIRAGEAYGWDFQHSLAKDFAFVARRQWIDLHAPVYLEDTVEIQTWLYHLRRTTAYRAYALRRVRDGMLVAYGCTYWAAIDVRTGRPTRIPDAFKHDLAEHIVPA